MVVGFLNIQLTNKQFSLVDAWKEDCGYTERGNPFGETHR